MRVKFYLLLLISICFFPIYGQQSINVPYDFPIKPGTEKWKEFKTGEEMVAACEIPINILQNMSTEALAETCLNYPLALDYSAFNDERVGIKHIINNFNGLQELSKRADGALELIKLYKKIPIDTRQVKISTQFKNNASILHISYLELLLADNCFKDKLSTSECVELQKIVQTKYEEKLKDNNAYSLFSIKKSLLLGTLLVNKIKGNSLSASKKNKILEFTETFKNPDITLVQEISKYIYE